MKFVSLLTTIVCWTFATSALAFQTGTNNNLRKISDTHSTSTFLQSEIGNKYPILATCRAEHGPVYAVSAGDYSVFEFNGETWNASLLEHPPNCASCDRQNRLWVGTDDGVYVGEENRAGILEFERSNIPFEDGDDRAFHFAVAGENGATLFNSSLVVDISPLQCRVRRFAKEEVVVHAAPDMILTINHDLNRLSIHHGEKTSFIESFRGVLATPLDDGSILELDHDNSLWIRTGEHRRIFSQQLQDQFNNREIFYFEQLRNDNVGIGTTDGFFECSAAGDLLRVVDTDDGLNDGFVYRAISDFDGNIWMIDGKGLAVVRLDQGRVQQRFAKRTTETWDLEQFENQIYFATTRGCQVLDPSTQQFRSIAELEGLYVSDLCNDGDSILAATSSGLFKITKDSAERVIEGQVTNVCRFEDSKVFAAVNEHNKISAASCENGWREIQSIQCSFAVSMLQSLSDTTIVVSGSNGEVQVLELDRLKNTLALKNVDMAGDCFGSANIDGEELYFLPAGLHRIVEVGGDYLFAPATDLPYSAAISRLFTHHQSYYTFFPINETQLAFCGNESIDVCSFSESGQVHCLGGWQLAHGLAIIPAIKHGSGQLLGVHDNFLIHFDLNQFPRNSDLQKPLVDVFMSDEATDGFDPSIGIDSHGGLRFSFSEPFGNFHPNSVEFQFRLVGLDKEWSDWTFVSQKEYMNLSGGNYQFQVRSRVSPHITSGIVTIPFYVIAPWYMSKWFFFVSTIGLLAIGYTFSQIRSRILARYNLRIENMVRARTPELELQKIRVKEQSELIIRQSQEHESMKLESLSAMLGAIAHDFNNLLCVITAHGEVLAKSSSERIRFSATNIKKAAGSASELCDQLHIVSGAFPIDAQHLNLSTLVQETTQLIKSSRPGNIDVEFKLKTSFEQNNIILGDPSELTRVIMNLIVNACEAANGNVCIETGSSDLSYDEIAGGKFIGDPPAPGKFNWFQVTDDGDGLSIEATQKLFDPFFSTKRLGRGLGLTIVMRIVGRHNGVIFVDSLCGSSPRSGTRFRVCLPSLGQAPVKIESATSSNPDSGSLNILIVDDDPAVLESLRTLLNVVGHKTLVEQSASRAINRLQEVRSLDLALIDLTMPEMMGDQLAWQITKLIPDLPIILMSGYSEINLDPELLQMPHIAFVGKPIRLEALNQKIQTLCHSAFDWPQNDSLSQMI